LETFVICEGGIHEPQAAAGALAAGADAVVVGTAITNTEWLVRQYSAALGQPKSWPA
jgi:putative N-acetylmannosamine-6-phosphate epimerase